MIMPLYSIFDKAIQAYRAPFHLRTDAEACRTFAHMVNDPDSVIGRTPQDFGLYRVGTFHDGIAELVNEDNLVHLGDGNEFIDREEDNG